MSLELFLLPLDLGVEVIHLGVRLLLKIEVPEWNLKKQELGATN